jgi:hypothetical protein
VGAEFFVEVGVEPVATEERIESDKKSAEEVH